MFNRKRFENVLFTFKNLCHYIQEEFDEVDTTGAGDVPFTQFFQGFQGFHNPLHVSTPASNLLPSPTSGPYTTRLYLSRYASLRLNAKRLKTNQMNGNGMDDPEPRARVRSTSASGRTWCGARASWTRAGEWGARAARTLPSIIRRVPSWRALGRDLN